MTSAVARSGGGDGDDHDETEADDDHEVHADDDRLEARPLQHQRHVVRDVTSVSQVNRPTQHVTSQCLLLQDNPSSPVIREEKLLSPL